MDNDLEIIVLGCVSSEIYNRNFNANGQIDTLDVEFKSGFDLNKIDDMVKIVAQKFQNFTDKPVLVRMVDQQYTINHYVTPEGKKYLKKLQKMRNQSNRFIFHDCMWTELGFIPNPDKIYFIITDEHFIDNYDFLNFLELSCKRNIYLAHSLQSFLDIENAVCPFNLFSGEELTQYRSFLGESFHFDAIAITRLIELGVTTIKYMKVAGIDRKERFMQEAFPAWVLNVENQFIKGIILEYDLTPTEIDGKLSKINDICTIKTIQEKFMESAEYRYLIFDYLCRVLAKFGLNIGKFNEVIDHQFMNFELLL